MLPPFHCFNAMVALIRCSVPFGSVHAPTSGRVAFAPSRVGQWMLPPASSLVVVQSASNRASASLVLVVSNVKFR